MIQVRECVWPHLDLRGRGRINSRERIRSCRRKSIVRWYYPRLLCS